MFPPASKPLTDDARPAGLFHRKEDELRLGINALIQSHQGLLTQLTGLAALHQAVDQLVKVPRQRVIWSGTAALNSDGIFTAHSGTGARAIFVVNPTGNGAVTVVAGPPAANGAPTTGPGVHIVAAGQAAVFNNETNEWTLYGTAGDTLEVQVFAVPIQPMSSAV